MSLHANDCDEFITYAICIQTTSESELAQFTLNANQFNVHSMWT